jgi:hypothetical protein
VAAIWQTAGPAMMRILWTIFMLVAWPGVILGQTTRPTIKLSSGVEDGKKMICGVVTLNGKPLENVTLQYFIKRTFGDLSIGEDTTLDDGTSAVPFPTDLPGDSENNLCAVARIKAPVQFALASGSQKFPVHESALPTADFPRALWAPHAPLALMLAIGAVVGVVWISYFFVIAQIMAIFKGR